MTIVNGNNVITAKDTKVMNATVIGGVAGATAGLGYAFIHKKKFWGYIGYMLLGAVVFQGVAFLGAEMLIKKDKDFSK